MSDYLQIDPDMYAQMRETPDRETAGRFLILNDNGLPFTGVIKTGVLVVARDFACEADAATWLEGVPTAECIRDIAGGGEDAPQVLYTATKLNNGTTVGVRPDGEARVGDIIISSHVESFDKAGRVTVVVSSNNVTVDDLPESDTL